MDDVIKIRNYKVHLLHDKIRTSVGYEKRKTLVHAFINVVSSGKLIDCKYDPATKDIYVLENFYRDNRESIEQTLVMNRFAVISAGYAKKKACIDLWTKPLMEMGISGTDIKECVFYLEEGHVTYNHILDLHIRGCDMEFSSDGTLYVKCEDDQWKIEKQDSRYVLFHNTYHILPDGSRVITMPYVYHLQKEYTSLRGALYAITNYSYEWHRIMTQEGLVKTDRFIDLYIRLKTKFEKRLFQMGFLKNREDARTSQIKKTT